MIPQGRWEGGRYVLNDTMDARMKQAGREELKLEIIRWLDNPDSTEDHIIAARIARQIERGDYRKTREADHA